MKYKSSRGGESGITPSQAIINGIAKDGGLYVPENIPKIENIEAFKSMSYNNLAFEILKLYFTDFTDEAIHSCVNKAYTDNFLNPQIAPLVKAGEDYFLELFHGKTLAFKDFALSILPHLMQNSLEINGVDKKIVILTATSGDTGTAALKGFASADDIKVVVFYPVDGVSLVQKLQMVTQEGSNTLVVAVKGNFDDAQTEVKKIFTDENIKTLLNENGYMLSSANSINIGRLIPQIVYYFYAYFQMVNKNEISMGEKINFAVPTGNFGNILAAYYAYKMGLPVHKLICASNKNKVLYDFISDGIYDKNREFYLTASPSMDILVSSNLERLLFECSDAEQTKKAMQQLNEEGRYTFPHSLGIFCAEFSNDSEAFAAIKELYSNTGYIMDTHTAVAYAALKKYSANKDGSEKTIIIATASPFKFAKSIVTALQPENNSDGIECLNQLADLSSGEIPAQLIGLDKKEILHSAVCEKGTLSAAVTDFLKI